MKADIRDFGPEEVRGKTDGELKKIITEGTGKERSVKDLSGTDREKVITSSEASDSGETAMLSCWVNKGQMGRLPAIRGTSHRCVRAGRVRVDNGLVSANCRHVASVTGDAVMPVLRCKMLGAP